MIIETLFINEIIGIIFFMMVLIFSINIQKDIICNIYIQKNNRIYKR